MYVHTHGVEPSCCSVTFIPMHEGFDRTENVVTDAFLSLEQKKWIQLVKCPCISFLFLCGIRAGMDVLISSLVATAT